MRNAFIEEEDVELMGTVTAIGAQDPEAWMFNTNTGTLTAVTSLTTVIGTRASIAFDTWEVAVGAAMVAARTSRGVKVNKVGGEWVVSRDAPVTYNPVPYYPTNPQPSWQYPYATTSGTHVTLSANGKAS